MTKLSNNKGFSLIEVLLTAGILAVVLCGLLGAYLGLILLGDISRQVTLATNAAQGKLEQVKNTNFDNLATLAGPFLANGFTATNASGSVQIINTGYGDLKEVRVTISFRSKNRIIGEDRNLNGTLDAGEDSNNNGRLDSPVELVTLIAR